MFKEILIEILIWGNLKKIRIKNLAKVFKKNFDVTQTCKKSPLRC